MLEKRWSGILVENPKKIRQHVEEDQYAILLDLLKSPLIDPKTRQMLEEALYAKVRLHAKAS